MSLLSFLGKIGRGIWRGIAFARPLAAAIGTAIPRADPFESVANLIATAEAVGEIVKMQGGSKLNKLQLILPQAEVAIHNCELLAHRQVLDEILFMQGVRDLVEAEIKLLKACAEPK